MSKNGEKWLILGGLAFAASLVVAIEVIRRKRTDPLAQANRLIARCNDKISEIEESVSGLQSIIQAAA
ncbi:MAG: hypothetical protein JSV65_18145 [Armatimonadota bacterium]|jgi:hypothetical protein|nr:MAG: hypothetical protein JSV65_18145 [Armatimonadota bacterium]